MAENQLSNKITIATKWSSITEVIAKIIIPLTNMILARILTPEAFGVVATITMIISFVDMFTDAGFQKYIVQRDFKTEDQKHRNANVAFWTNFSLSIVLWSILNIFSDQIASIVGNPGLGIVIIFASLQLPLTSFSSIQMALFRREFDFRSLFFIRVISISIPFVVTIPLALIGLNYWSLIIGTLCMQLFNAVLLTIKSKWKPKFYFNFVTLREMLSFSIWTLIERISIWLTVWADIFIIGSYFNEYYLGIYKTSTMMVNSLLAIITMATVPVVFSALSRLKNNNKKFQGMFLKFQRLASVLIFPLGMGIFLYSDLATQLILGHQWDEASNIIGVWTVTSIFMILFGHYCSEVYRAKGKPKLSFMAQVLHLAVLIPTCIIAAKFGFWALVFARSLVRLQLVAVHFIIMQVVMKITFLRMLKNVAPSAISVIAMSILGYMLKEVSASLIWSFISIVLCASFYFGVLSLFPGMRIELKNIIGKLVPRKVSIGLKSSR